MRLLLLRSEQAKARLEPALAPGNVAKAMSAPILAVIALLTPPFYRDMPRLFPHRPEAGQRFVNDPALAEKRPPFATGASRPPTSCSPCALSA